MILCNLKEISFTDLRFSRRHPLIYWRWVVPVIPLDLQRVLVPLIQGVVAVEDGRLARPVAHDVGDPQVVDLEGRQYREEG